MIDMKKCCGCWACVNICPQKCISMKLDELGFQYPKINTDKCLKCGLCKKVCPVTAKKIEGNVSPMAWGGYINDPDLRKASSSGGLFSAFALRTIELGGVVFGASLSRDMRSVKHIMVENKKDLEKLRGSKYVQSDIGDTFRIAKKILDEGRYVLFSGTPCQIEGLSLFLNKDYSNLLTIEIICHGTPSPKIYRKYIDYMEEKLDDTIVNVSFRDEIGEGY